MTTKCAKIKLMTFAVLLVSICSITVYPHDALEKQIANVSREIASKPEDASLRLRRAELYRLHKEWKNAETDLNVAKRIAPRNNDVHFAFGRLFYDLERFTESKDETSIYLKQNPTSYGGTLLLANIYRNLGSPEEADAMYSKAISLSPSDSAELYLLRAATLADAGDLEMSLAGLDEGIRKLGGLIVLQSYAIELEVRLGKLSDALKRNEMLMATMSRKEGYLLRKGEILLLAGRECEAKSTLQKALIGYQSYSEFKKRVGAIKTEINKMNTLIKKAESCSSTTQQNSGYFQTSTNQPAI